MADRIAELQARIDALGDALHRVERRLARLESVRPAPPPRPAVAEEPEDADVGADLAAAAGHLHLAGRTLLALAGGFLLRWLTDAAVLPVQAGVALGLAYAVGWLALAARAAPASPWSAGFHAAAAILVADPLLFEATTRFRLLSPAAACAGLALFTAVALGVAAARRAQAVAWVAELGALAVALALMVETGRLVPPLLLVVALGVAALWIAYVRDWFLLRWPPALVADLLVPLVALAAASPRAPGAWRAALALEVVFMAAYLGSVATRTLLLGRGVVAFEVFQAAAVLVGGLGGASWLVVHAGQGTALLGGVATALGLAAYAVGFAFVERRQAPRNFHLYSSLALAFVLAGTALVLPGAPLSIGWAALAVIAAALARRFRRRTLAAHAVVYGALAAVVGGLLGDAAGALLAGSPGAWTAADAAREACALAALAAAAWLGAAGAEGARGMARAPRAALLALLAAAAAGFGVRVAVALLHGAAVPSGPGALGAVRTAAVVAVAVALAWAGRRPGWRDAGALAYPVVLALGLTLVAQDLADRRAATLVFELALYGGALIAIPRLRRGAPAAARAAPAPPARRSDGG